MMTKLQFRQIINDNPTLTAHGFGVDKGAAFETERTALYGYYQEALVSEAFLSQCKQTTNTFWRSGTYKLKHLAEVYAEHHGLQPTYIREGAFIVAGIHLGFRMKPWGCSTSVSLNIDKKTKIDGIRFHSYS